MACTILATPGLQSGNKKKGRHNSCCLGACKVGENQNGFTTPRVGHLLTFRRNPPPPPSRSGPKTPGGGGGALGGGRLAAQEGFSRGLASRR